jgi:hypothetical protein
MDRADRPDPLDHVPRADFPNFNRAGALAMVQGAQLNCASLRARAVRAGSQNRDHREQAGCGSNHSCSPAGSSEATTTTSALRTNGGMPLGGTRSGDARRALQNWRRDYNEVRPHSSLGDVPPAAFAARIQGLAPNRPVRETPILIAR